MCSVIDHHEDVPFVVRPKEIAEEADYAGVKHLVRRMVDDDQLDTDGKGSYFLPVHPVHHVHHSLLDSAVHHSPPQQPDREDRCRRDQGSFPMGSLPSVRVGP